MHITLNKQHQRKGNVAIKFKTIKLNYIYKNNEMQELYWETIYFKNKHDFSDKM